MKNLPQRWTTIAKKNSSTAQRWMLLKKRPRLEMCHQVGPFSPRIIPETTITIRAGDRGDAEHVYPGGDVGGLAVGE